MERLRAAIEQARKSRVETGPASAASEANLRDVGQNPVQTNGNGHPNGSAKPAATNGAKGPAPIKISREDSAIRARWEALDFAQVKPARLRRNRILVEGKGPERAAYDMLRTRLLTVIQKEGWRRVAITSPTMACGKSTTALNLAFSLARMPDVRTLVIETDLRRPSMAKMLRFQPKASVFDVLKGQADFSEQAVRLADNVAVSINREPAPNPAEILHGQNTPKILDMIQEAYQPDIILFDMPPMMQSDDTLGFIKHVDCALLLAQAERTTLEQIDFCESELAANTNVAGVILNRCRYTGSQYSYGYADY